MTNIPEADENTIPSQVFTKNRFNFRSLEEQRWSSGRLISTWKVDRAIVTIEIWWITSVAFYGWQDFDEPGPILMKFSGCVKLTRNWWIVSFSISSFYLKPKTSFFRTRKSKNISSESSVFIMGVLSSIVDFSNLVATRTLFSGMSINWSDIFNFRFLKNSLLPVWGRYRKSKSWRFTSSESTKCTLMFDENRSTGLEGESLSHLKWNASQR